MLTTIINGHTWRYDAEVNAWREMCQPTAVDPADAPPGYYAEAREGCFGCAFAVPGTQECNIGPSQTCRTAGARKDGCSVIFRKKEDQPSGDDAATVSAKTHAYAVRYAEQMIAERDKALADLAAERGLSDAIERSGLDISLCRGCGKLVVCIPDGLSNICEACAEKESK